MPPTIGKRRQCSYAGLRYDGVTAPFILDVPIGGLNLLVYVEQFLAPTLKKGQIIFMDNAKIHKAEAVEDVIEARLAPCLSAILPHLY